MKKVFALLSLLYASCTLLNPDSGIGTSRWSEEHANVHDGDEKVASTDTLVYLSSVSVPPGYDWRKDSLDGEVNCTIHFCRGKMTCDSISFIGAPLSIPTGRGERVSSDTDRHHIIDGHIYTEYSDASGTYIGKDGNIILSYSGREFVVGILQYSGSLWTLGRDPSGGFALRQDGEIRFRSASGKVFGGFAHQGYGDNGALYVDDGKVCFSYSVALNGRACVYLVRDGTESPVLAAGYRDVIDAKSLGGKDAVVCNYTVGTVLHHGAESVDLGMDGFLRWSSGGLAQLDGQPVIAGNFSYEGGGSLFGGLGSFGRYFDLGVENTAIVWSDEAALGAGVWEDGHVFYLGCGYNGLVFCSGFSDERCYLFSQDCVALLGKRYYLALTPMDAGQPYILDATGTIKAPIGDFLTGIKLQVVPDG